MATEKKTAAEVGVKLVVDSNAKAATAELTKDLKKVDDAAKSTTRKIDTSLKANMGSIGKLVLGGVGLTAAAALAAGGAVLGFAHKSAEAFQEAGAQIKELAGTLLVIDQNGNDFGRLKGYAGDLKDELEDLAMQVGITDDAALSMFTDLIERGGKTIESAQELTEQLAYAGRALPGGPEALAAGFQQMEMGMVRARNPLVQLIASTHTLKGSAKQVAKEMQKMPIDEQMKLAEKAVGKMSAKMKDVPMSMGEMKKSLAVGVGNIFEDAGKPIVAGMRPIVTKIKDLFFENKDAITEMANGLGEKIGQAMEVVVPIIDEIQRAIKDNWSEIKSAFEALYGPGKELFEYIYEHKGEFARTIGDMASVFIKVATFMIKAASMIRDAIAATAKFLGRSAAFIGTGGESAKYFAQEDNLAQTKSMQAAIKEKGGLSTEDFEKRRAEYVKTATEGGLNATQAFQDFETQYRRAMDDHIAVMKEVEGARDAAMTDNGSQFAAMFAKAKESNDKAAMEYVAAFLKENESLQNALAKDGPDIFKGGFDALLTTLKGMGEGQTADDLKKKMRPNLGINPKANIVQNFNGQINIKQDFRDQDPDRVALVFREDLAKAGANRLQSRFAMPFGF